MPYRLVISEKPSVAMSYAKVLGATSRKDGYLEGNGYLVSWCVGHLVELAPPNVYDEKYVKWSIADLPILPKKWQYLVSASTKKQFGVLKDLMNRPDVDSIVNSCDSGREGELIFRLVYQQAGCKKPFSRLWLSSMEDSAIREGFAHLKPSTEYDALYNAALCRERADWMVGINASRLFSCLYGQPLAVGRVMTPVLAMTVVREAAIAAFVPEKFYTVALTLADGGIASSKRFAQKADAELLLSKCRKEGRITVQKMERKEKSESPPQLYDLTALQRDANRLLGFTAQQTLDYAQSLYEKRLITYPRTDSRFLTEDMAASLPGLVADTGKAFAVEEPIPIHVQQVINGSKVTDHHALLPTKSMANADLAALPAGERNVLRLIATRLICAVGEPHRYAETMLITICAGEEFSVKGKVVLSEGWKAMERKMLGELLGKQKPAVVLPDVQEQSQCSFAGAELKEGQTSPPKSYTEDTLLSAMQAAGANSIPEGVERQGIGTPATRAATIEKLVQKGFLERKGNKKTKVLLPTDKGKALITVMPEEIQSPEMTADWETKLLRIERGEMEPEEFMTEINALRQEEPDVPELTDEELDELPISAVIDGEVQTFPDAAALNEALNAEPIPEPAGNFHITDEHLGEGGAKQKYARNIEVIKTLFRLEEEHRGASAEEQEVLAQYVGWGGLADAFDLNKDNWAKEYTELKGMLSEDEYAAARGSVLNAHYTSPTVIHAIYDAVEKMGFRSGNILEPSMGVGNFFGMLPDTMQDSRLYGVELDSITGRIAQKLYPQADITVAGFETTDRRDFYDLAVGNVPFGNYKVADKA